MKKFFGFIFAFVIFSFIFASFALAKEQAEIIFFWGDGCPHCASEEKFLEKIEQQYPELEIKRYEVWYNAENQKLLNDAVKKYKVPQLAVPLTIVGDKYFLGYQADETTGKAVEEQIKILLEEEKADGNKAEETVKAPFLGEISLSKLSLPALTVLLGLLDGFNPCAMWILLFLISLLITAGSRKRVWLIGGTFILASGVVYFLILSAWLNLFLAIGYVSLTRILIGIFALGAGIWQIKNFISYHPNICKVVGLKPRFGEILQKRAKKIVASPFTWLTIGGLIVLALGVSLLEFFCSAGLPAAFTRILALNSLNQLTYYFYLLLYTFVFMLDDLIIFSIAVITLKKIGLTEKYNYWATLIGGLLIFILGILLIFKPGLLMFGS